MENNTIGTKILKLRKERGMTQAQLASEVNVSPQAVSKWENGDAMPDVEMFAVLAKIFNVSIDYLILDDAEEPCADDTIDDGLDMEADTTIDVNNEDIEIVIEPETHRDEQEAEQPQDDTIDESASETEEAVTAPKEDVKALRRRLATLRTVKWSVAVMPSIMMILLYGVILALMIICKGWIMDTMGGNEMAYISTVIVVAIVLALMLINYVIFKTAMRYRIFLRGREEDKFPHNFATYLAGGTKKALLWLSRYMIAIKLLYDERKVLDNEIEELTTKIVSMGYKVK